MKWTRISKRIRFGDFTSVLSGAQGTEFALLYSF